MSRNRSFRRKIAYGTIIALLSFPLFYLGQPAAPNEQGGKLAQMRTQYSLAQATLGEIDPASETMKLVTLGLRPVAWMALMERAETYKKKENWDALAVTLNQLTKLDPNVIAIWEFQAHNLSYNVSVEFDDYRHRYLWVKKGIDFLILGTHYNRNEPKLDWNIGWYLGHKIGKSDEQRPFRRMFRGDEDFHLSLQTEGEVVIEQPDAQGPDGRPDNWLVGRQWYIKAENAVNQGRPLRGKSPLLFYADAPMARINFSTAIEEEGWLDEKARIAWEKSGTEWRQYGDRSIPHTSGHMVRLNDMDRLIAEREAMEKKLDELVPGAREKIAAEKKAALTAEQLALMAVPIEARSPQQNMMILATNQGLVVTPVEIALRASEENKAKALNFAERIMEHEEIQVGHTAAYRNQVNYPYWATRCQMEQTATAVDARRLIFEADKFMDNADPENAKKAFEESFEKWAQLMVQFPELRDDLTFTDLGKEIGKYNQVLGQLDLKLPADFKLKELWVRHAERNNLPRELSADASKEAEKPQEKSEKEPAKEEKPQDKPAEKPAEGKPADEKPAEKPTEEKPSAEKPAEPKPAEEKPTAEKPAEEKPSNE